MSKVTKASLIAELANAGQTKRQAYETLRPMVLSGQAPMVFKRNPTAAEKALGITNRIPLAVSEQLIALKDQIGRTYSAMGKAVSSDFDSEEISDDVPAATPDESPAEIPAEDVTPEPEPEPESEPVSKRPRAKGKPGVREQLDYFGRRMADLRRIVREKEERNSPIDDLGARPEEHAGSLIVAGIPADALIDVATMTWPKDVRQEAGISKFDFNALSNRIRVDRELPTHTSEGRPYHSLFPYVLTLVEEGTPVFLIGPQGSGKSTLCRQVADYLKLPYGETACSAGASRGDFYGRMTANPDRWFIQSKFTEIHSGGGVFNFEEIDAALPEVLIALNNALAGKSFFNSADGDEYILHPDMRPMATGNTAGNGANPLYVARERLDSATLDRWRMGRVFVPFDQSIADYLLYRKVGGK